MSDTLKREEKANLIENKKQQIEKILMEDDMTFGMAKTVIQAVEADLFGNGNTFLNKSALKNVLPFKS